MVKRLGTIFSVVGLLALTACGYSYWSTDNLRSTGSRATGKVIELRPTSKGAYAPVVQFETADHKTITAASKVGSNPPAHKVSDAVTVLYRADSPEDFRLDDPLELFLVTGIFGILGLVFLSVGGGMLFFAVTRPSNKSWSYTKNR